MRVRRLGWTGLWLDWADVAVRRLAVHVLKLQIRIHTPLSSFSSWYAHHTNHHSEPMLYMLYVASLGQLKPQSDNVPVNEQLRHRGIR